MKNQTENQTELEKIQEELKATQNEKDHFARRLNIVIQQRNSFLDQIVLLQEQLELKETKAEK